MKLLCTGLRIYCGVDSLPELTATFLIPVTPRDINLLGELVGKSVSLLADGVDLVGKGLSGNQRCFHCAQLSPTDALECRKCGAPLEI